ncbi:MAG: MCE family protein [Bacteroidaceae bacterium]|nr:MCE family protein [Bacteroidaceae bacterium]
MEKKKGTFTRELWIGLLGIASIVIVYLLINFFKGINIFSNGEKYYVRFSNIGEIVNTSPIFINGYKVGHVSNVIYNFENPDEVYVEMLLDSQLQMPEGSVALINTKMLGSSTISLALGKSATMINPGDTIEGRMNTGAMDEAAEMIPQITAMLPKLDSILVSLNSTLANPAINSSVDNIEELTAELNTTAKLLNNVLANDIPVATGKLVEIEDDLLKMSSQLSEVDYNKLIGSLEASLTNIQNITAALNNGEGTAGMLLKDSTLYNKLNNTTEAATLLLEDLKQNPKRYVHFSIFGRKEKADK